MAIVHLYILKKRNSRDGPAIELLRAGSLRSPTRKSASVRARLILQKII
jgi:hypothetical protein